MPRRTVWYSSGQITVIHTSRQCPFFQNILPVNRESDMVEIDEDRMPINLNDTVHYCEECKEIAEEDAIRRQKRQSRQGNRSRRN